MWCYINILRLNRPVNSIETPICTCASRRTQKLIEIYSDIYMYVFIVYIYIRTGINATSLPNTYSIHIYIYITNASCLLLHIYAKRPFERRSSTFEHDNMYDAPIAVFNIYLYLYWMYMHIRYLLSVSHSFLHSLHLCCTSMLLVEKLRKAIQLFVLIHLCVCVCVWYVYT